MKEITLEDYVLTNINPELGFVIRLKDNNEYKVFKNPKEYGNKFYIKKDGEILFLNDKVKKIFNSECNVYNRDGI